MVPANQVYDRVLWGASLEAAGLGSPNSRTPDIIITMKEGYINVGGNPGKKYTFKRAEHGGFVEDDRHVPLLVAGGLLPAEDQGLVQKGPAYTTQIAVSALEALGLDPDQLQGAVAEKTQPLTIDLTGQVRVRKNGPVMGPKTGTYTADLTITNPVQSGGPHSTPSPTLAGGFGILLANLTPGVALQSATITVGGTTYNLAIRYDAAGDPIVTIPNALVSSLGAGQSLPKITLTFRNPSNKHFDFDTQVFSDPFAF
jgi:hypothetical protein